MDSYLDAGQGRKKRYLAKARNRKRRKGDFNKMLQRTYEYFMSLFDESERRSDMNAAKLQNAIDNLNVMTNHLGNMSLQEAEAVRKNIYNLVFLFEEIFDSDDDPEYQKKEMREAVEGVAAFLEGWETRGKSVRTAVDKFMYEANHLYPEHDSDYEDPGAAGKGINDRPEHDSDYEDPGAAGEGINDRPEQGDEFDDILRNTLKHLSYFLREPSPTYENQVTEHFQAALEYLEEMQQGGPVTGSVRLLQQMMDSLESIYQTDGRYREWTEMYPRLQETISNFVVAVHKVYPELDPEKGAFEDQESGRMGLDDRLVWASGYFERIWENNTIFINDLKTAIGNLYAMARLLGAMPEGVEGDGIDEPSPLKQLFDWIERIENPQPDSADYEKALRTRDFIEKMQPVIYPLLDAMSKFVDQVYRVYPEYRPSEEDPEDYRAQLTCAQCGGLAK